MNQLLKIALIKSAKFEYSELDLVGNTLLIGANGAGKTTLLRAILYFYTANAKSLGINTAKKSSFSDYYFEYENSYIAYVYKKDKKYILVIVYKMSTIFIKLCMFNEMPNLQEIFIQNNKVLLPQELFINLKNRAVLSNALKPSEYLKTLYGKMQKEFSLFFLKDYSGFIKTLSNIFINSKVDSNTIKKVLTNSLDEDIIIDLDRIKRQLSEFETTYNDIKLYEANLKNIQKIINYLHQIEATKNELSLNFSTIEYSKISYKKEIEALQNELDNKNKELFLIEEEFKKDKKRFENKINSLIEEIGYKKRKIKELEQKKANYENEQIEFKIKEFQKLQILEKNLEDLKEQKEFLTKKQTDLKKANENEINRLKNNFQSQENILLSKKLSQIEQINKQIDLLKDKKTDELDEINKFFTQQKEDIQQQINKLNLELNNIENKIIQINEQIFKFEDEDNLKNLYLEKNNLQNNKKLLSNQVKFLSNEIDKLEEKFVLKEKNLKERFEQKIDILNEQIKNQKELLSPNQNSLLNRLYEKNLDTKKYLYFLKDEVLKKEFEFSFLENKNNIFEIDFKDLKSFNLDLNLILQKLTNELNSVKKEFNEALKELKSEFEKEERKLILKKKKLNEQLNENDIKLVTIETKIDNLEIKKDELQKIFNENKNNQINSLNKKAKTIKEQLKALNNKLNNIKNQQKSKQTSIKIFYTKEKNLLKEKRKGIEEEFNKNIKQLNNDLEQKLKIQEQNYKNLLKKENIDIEKLNQIDKNLQNLQNQIDLIKSYERLIIRYEEDLKEFEKIKLYKKELKQLQENLTNTKESFLQKEKIFEDTKKDLNQKISHKKTKLDELKKEYDDFCEFEESVIFIDAKSLVKFENIEEKNSLALIQKQITNLEHNYKNIKETITKEINKIAFIFDNSLNIKKEADILKTAKNLQEFYELNKIEQFKDLLNNKLNYIVKVLNDEYEKLSNQTNKIKRYISKINLLFKEIDIGVIDEIELRYSKTNNKAINLLEDIKILNDQNYGFGISLFSNETETKQMIDLLKKLVITINDIGLDSISLEDSFLLEFRVVENGNDSGYQISLDNIGSNGTDVLVKSMIYIAMVYINKKDSNVINHVILDEIGILSQKFLKALIEFANKYKILFINGAPDEKLIGTYKKVYLIKRDKNYSSAIEIIGMGE